jgi:hypothetical protein
MIIQTTPSGLTIILDQINGKYELRFVRDNISTVVQLSELDLKYVNLVTNNEE